MEEKEEYPDLGCGVPKLVIVESPTEEQLKKEKELAETKIEEKLEAQWSRIPTTVDQYEKYRDTCRLIGPSMDSFEISVKEQKEDLNNILKNTQPYSAPNYILVDKPRKEFFEGKWYVLLEYYIVEYKQLILPN